MKIERLTGTNTRTGKPRKGVKVTMTEAKYARMSEDSEGLCVLCGETASCVEPDARGYACEACEEPGVYGAEECLLLGRIVLS
jgi:hypothetical protein